MKYNILAQLAALSLNAAATEQPLTYRVAMTKPACRSWRNGWKGQ